MNDITTAPVTVPVDTSVQPGLPPIAPAAPPVAAPPAAPPAAPASWLDKLTPEDRTYAESKGWKSDTPPDALFTSYKNLEKVWGADKAGRALLLPKDDSDTAALDAIYDKLGRPADPSGYEIALPEGADAAFADKAKGWFHKAGLSAAQAKAVTEAYQAAEMDQATELEKRDVTDKAALETEWGADYTQKVETAKRGIAAAGLSQEEVRSLELAVGPARATKMLEFFGRNYTEGKPLEGASPPAGFGSLNPAQAAAKINELYGDANFMSRYNNADPKVRALAQGEMETLSKLAVNAKQR
jgi:hypothetical protein